jgi:hypothetical protein
MNRPPLVHPLLPPAGRCTKLRFEFAAAGGFFAIALEIGPADL